TRGRGDTETRRHGDKRRGGRGQGTWGRGDTERRRRGETEGRGDGDTERRGDGDAGTRDAETWRYGDAEIRRRGDAEIRRHGDARRSIGLVIGVVHEVSAFVCSSFDTVEFGACAGSVKRNPTQRDGRCPFGGATSQRPGSALQS